ncbi:hypothetical protein RchiOBHm_Chr1g0334071 [Rosa chinensis]|uniref:Secreted protein n=1 Tax=Rosa chinensis TaxID=74649 RepID=A0A2P6SC71_ROSCH|nr:hypothetical protein RchiOBHm_Chr1g0334071 [Rosa chinensis]
MGRLPSVLVLVLEWWVRSDDSASCSGSCGIGGGPIPASSGGLSGTCICTMGPIPAVGRLCLVLCDCSLRAGLAFASSVRLSSSKRVISVATWFWASAFSLRSCSRSLFALWRSASASSYKAVRS